MATYENLQAAKAPACIALGLLAGGNVLLAAALGVAGGLLVGLLGLSAACFAWGALFWRVGNLDDVQL